MCGIVGIKASHSVNQDLYDALITLQHRGQDAAGMITSDEARFFLRKNKGLVRDVFHWRHMIRLQGHLGIGHVRYPTAGTDSELEAQPFYVNSPYGLALVHNGNLTNAAQLSKEIFSSDLRHLNTASDSEVLLNVLAHELQQLHQLHLTPDSLFKVVSGIHRRCRGAYAAIVLIAGYGLLAFRDPFGIRPLIYGQRKLKGITEYMFASESVALDVLGFEMIEDVAPGEAIYVDLNGNIHKKQCAPYPQLSPCLFEFVYMARPDSILDKISVYKTRLRMGEKLAEKILKVHPQHDIDVVIPIPDTSRTAALPLALRLGVKYREGFIKNRYIGRTFIMPDQTLRHKSVQQKLNPIALEFKNKNVLLVDDSIVRGTTSGEIVKMARQAGARKVYFASAAPPVRYPNVYGIDMPTRKELIAADLDASAIADKIGADWLIFQDLEALYQSARERRSDIKHFEDSVFTGHYITEDVDESYLSSLEVMRNSAKRESKSIG